MRIAYPEAYLAGAPALGALVFGIAAFALFVITATVLTSAGQPRVAALIAGVSLGVVLVATRFFIVAAGPTTTPCWPPRSAPARAPCSRCLGAGAAVYARFRAFLPPLSVVRGALAGAGAFAAAAFIPHGSRVMSIVALAGGFAAFLLGLVHHGRAGQERAQGRALGPWRLTKNASLKRSLALCGRLPHSVSCPSVSEALACWNRRLGRIPIQWR
jgi:hypothetical protein